MSYLEKVSMTAINIPLIMYYFSRPSMMSSATSGITGIQLQIPFLTLLFAQSSWASMQKTVIGILHMEISVTVAPGELSYYIPTIDLPPTIIMA